MAPDQRERLVAPGGPTATGCPRARAAVLLAALAGGACTRPPEAEGEPAGEGPAATAAIAPAPAAPGRRAAAFSGDLAFDQLATVVAMGPRLPDHPGHAAFRSHVRRELTALGARVEEHPFSHLVPGEPSARQLVNVSARLGELGEGWILLGAHFDTRPWADRDPDPALRSSPIPGANDGGSGVAVLLEIARVLAAHPPQVGVELWFFDGEDLGRPNRPREYSAGAQDVAARWDELRPGPRPAAAVIVDMVGDADLRIRPEGQSQQAFPDVTRSLWQAAERLGYPQFVEGPPIVVFDDHVPFLEAGIPSALVIDLEYAHWHTVADTLDKCSPESLEAVGRVVLEALFDAPERAASGSG